MALTPDVVARVLRHMNDDHAADSLVIVQAHGHPDATSASMVDVDEQAGTWRVEEPGGGCDVRLAWRGGPAADASQLRAAVVELHRVAASALRLSYAMGEHGMLRYSADAASI